MRILFCATIGLSAILAGGALAAETGSMPDHPPLPAAAPKVATDPVPLPPEVDACRASALIAVKQRSPAVQAIDVDPDSVSISKVDMMIEQTHVRTVVLGDANIDTRKTEKPHQFVCLIGGSGKVLFTFFTQK